MNRPDSRDASFPSHRTTTAISKNDDSSSSSTPQGGPSSSENSVAYQYVAVNQMTSRRDHIEYQLTVREQPKQSRMCGVGEKADRRPIDPAPIVQLRVITHDRPVRQGDLVETASVAPPVERRPGQGAKLPKTPGVRKGLPVSTALGDGWEDKAWYLENPYFFMYAMLCHAETDEELHLLSDGKTRYTSGSCVSCLYHLKDIDGSHQGFFVFPDLSIRVEGRYRLKLCLFETIGQSVHHCKSIYSDPFHVYTAKRFPGMEESTKLSKSFAEQGLKVRVRKHPRSRRRGAGSKRGKEESDGSEGGDAMATMARENVSPKRARVSDILPMSGLAAPHPSDSRMPRSMDARYERGDYGRKPFGGGMRPGWEEEEMMRRDPRGFDQRLYERRVREEREMEFAADGRYIDSHPRIHAGAPPPQGTPSRGPPEYGDYRGAYDDAPRSLRPPPQAVVSPAHPSHPSFPSHSSRPPSRNWIDSQPPPPGPSLIPTPVRAHARPNGPPDHHPASRGYEDYRASPARPGPRYIAPYDGRDGRPSPSPPPAGAYDGRAGFRPSPTPQWRSGPPSPRRTEYPADFPTRRAGVATPPGAYHRDTYPSAPRYDPYARPSDYPTAGTRYAGEGGRPMLPPLSAAPTPSAVGGGYSELEREREWELERDLRLREREREREWSASRRAGGGPPPSSRPY